MDKKQQASQLVARAANAKRKGHYGAARNLREQLNDVQGQKKPRKAAKKTAAKKTAAKTTTAKKTTAKKAAAKKS